MDGNNVPLEHPKEEQLRRELEDYKYQYRQGVSELRNLKSEIEGIQKMLENSRKRMQADFENWLQVMSSQVKSQRTGTPSVQEHLDAFYKAREDIYNSLSNG